MGMDKYRCFMQYMFIINETIVNIEHEDQTNGNRCFQRTCSFLLDTWKQKYQVPITALYLLWAIYWHKPVYIIHTTEQLTSSEHAKSTFINYYCICLPLCATYCSLFWCS